jgi:peptidoglycan/LPS O-acetylase OafA/YrhL
MIYYLYHPYIGVPGKVKEFLLKRFVKIYPLYWFATLAVMVSWKWFPQLENGHALRPDIIVKSLLLYPTDPILAATWSLSNVMLFYLVFGLWIARPKVMRFVLPVWVAVSLLAESGLVFKPNLFLFSFSNLEILLGTVIAYLVMNYRIPYAKLWIALGCCGFFLVWTNNVYQAFKVNDVYFYCLFAFCIMLGVTQTDMEKTTKLPKPLLWLADSSYSLFVIQLPVLHFYMLMMAKLHAEALLGNFLFVCAAAGLTILTGGVVYTVVEKPLSAFCKRRLLPSTQPAKGRALAAE